MLKDILTTNDRLLEYVKEKIPSDGKLLYLIECGSFLYGTQTEVSDKDYVGVYIGGQKNYYGIHYNKFLDIGTTKTEEHKKNTKGDFDIKLYDLKYFITLVIKGNPNIVEMLFLDKDSKSTIFCSGDFLLMKDEIKRNILSKTVINSFIGYMKSQGHLMFSKTKYLSELKKIKSRISEMDGNKTILDCMDNDYISKTFRATTQNPNLVTISDLHMFNIKDKLKFVEKRISSVINKYGNRINASLDVGYDTKFAYHLLRLSYEAEDLLIKGEISFPFDGDRLKILMDARRGKLEFEYIQRICEETANRVEKELQNKNLKKNICESTLNILLISFLKQHFSKLNKI